MSPQFAAMLSPADELFYGGQAGGGKALAIDTSIPTLDGWSTMGDIKAGETVFDEAGNPCSVLATSEVFYNHECFEVVFSDGFTIIADANHTWLTKTIKERSHAHFRTDECRKRRRARRKSRSKGKRPDVAQSNKERIYDLLEPSSGSVRSTQEIFKTAKVRNRTNHSVVVQSPLILPEKDLLIDPYVLGIWLGDGSSYKAEITTADIEVADEVKKHYRIKHRKKLAYGVYGLLTQLKALELIANKHIPRRYLRASCPQRLALLQGLMDSDGYCDPRGQCEFTTTKESLRDGTLELLGTLGIKAAVSTGRAMLDGRDCGPKYRIKFLTSLAAFRLSRKLNRQKRNDFRGTHEQRYIVGVNSVASVPVRCIAVDSLSHLYLAGRAFVPTHNSDLALGLATTLHRRSLVLRRTYTQLTGAGGLIQRSREIIGKNGRYNGQEHMWRDIPGDRMLEFGSCQYENDKHNHKGRPHDLKVFDELPEFTESMYRFITAWTRTTIPGQRVRNIGTGNPPTSAEGEWVINYWGPWLNPQHSNPARPGELRWFAVLDGEDVEVESGAALEHKGESIKPKSRTFIPARLDDNPFLRDTDYSRILQGLPEPLRSQLLYGDFDAAKEIDPWQVIPTEWVLAAQARWREREKPTTPMSALGVDPSRGGRDDTVLAPRYDNWFDELLCYPGARVKDGPAAVALVVNALGNNKAPVNVDIIGIGSSVFDSGKNAGLDIRAVNFAEGSNVRDKTGRLKMRNLRAAAHWKFREALDPQTGDDIALPDDRQLLADLCAPRYSVPVSGVTIEPKESVKKRLGRSPDRGEAVILAHWSQGGVFFA